MKAIQINQYGKHEILKCNEIAIPTPSSKQVLVKIYTASVNPVDWKLRDGILHERFPLPFPTTLGMDFSGVVQATGNEVTDFKEGDEVYGTSDFFGSDSGTFAEYAVISNNAIAHKPKSISHIEAASLPMAAISAWQALIQYMNLQKGQKILIHGGAGSIGTFAIQIAKWLGAYVSTTSRKNSKQFVKALGSDEVIDYQTQSFEALLHDYDAVLDTVGGEVYQKSFRILKKKGMIVSMLEKPDLMLMKQYQANAILEFTDINTQHLNKITQLIANEKIVIPIARIYPLKEANEAMRFQEYGHPRGKIVIEVFS